MMRKIVLIQVLLLWFTELGLSGSPCPPSESIRPCFCSMTNQNHTLVICNGIQNSSELAERTKPLKSMIIDRFILLNLYSGQETPRIEDNIIQENGEVDVNAGERLPKNWLSSVRVREIEIQDAGLSNCFLCSEPLSGQGDFLTGLSVTHAGLEGHLCMSCNTKIKSVSTRELQKTPKLSHVDLSFNKLEVISGYSFPPTSTNLKIINLSNNNINKVHDNAFSNLALTELDLSNNALTTITRKMFRTSDPYLKFLDLSWNSILSIPDDMFTGLRSLRELRLNNNLLEVLDANAWSRMPSLMERVDVKGNFLTCNCSLSWISTRLSKSTRMIGRCAAPTQVESQELKTTLSSLEGCRG